MLLGTRQINMGTATRRKSPSDTTSHSIISGPMRALELAFQQADARKTEIYRRGMLPARPTLIEHGPLRILVSSTPSPHNLDDYARTLRQYNVKHVVRVCEPTYEADALRRLDFDVHEWSFADGEAPPEHIVLQWLSLLDNVFELHVHARAAAASASSSSALASYDGSSDSDRSVSSLAKENAETVALHCVAGLGRAPVLAAIALVELGLEPFEAVGWIRALRRGAINAAQMAFLEKYSRRPPPPAVKPPRSRSRSGSFVGSLWPSLKAARPFRPRSPQQDGANQSSPISSARRLPGSPLLLPRSSGI